MKPVPTQTNYVSTLTHYSDSFWSQLGKFFNLVIHFPLFTLTYVALAGLLITVIALIRKLLILKRILKENSVLLEITPPAFSDKTANTTQNFFSIIHGLGTDRNLKNLILENKTIFSLEIVSTLNQGIRYLIRTTPDEAEIIKKDLLSYYPQVKIKEVNEYLPTKEVLKTQKYQIIEFKQRKHFAYPLQKHELLKEHDPVSYITAMMTKLSPGDLVSFQLVISPTTNGETNYIANLIRKNGDVLKYLNKVRIPAVLVPVQLILKLATKLTISLLTNGGQAFARLLNGDSKPALALDNFQYQQQLQSLQNLKPERVISTFEQETIQSVQQKIDQPLFEATVRAMVVVSSKKDLGDRVRGMNSSLSSFSIPRYQQLKKRWNFPSFLIDPLRELAFRKRVLSLSNKSPNLLSVSEIASLYHFPTSKTEDVVKSFSGDLAAPLSLKQGEELDVVFGVNNYGGVKTPIGLTDEQRKTHIYMIGRTGSGKTTAMFAMAKDDIDKGKGVAFIDPEGDVSQDLLSIIPQIRINDLVYFNPTDMKKPIGINLLELTPGLDEDEADLEKDVVAEGALSLFRKVFSKDETDSAHRIEYILRNTIHTAFTIPDRTIFTVYKLLNNPKYLKSVLRTLDDEDLQDFWKNEFGRAGDYQIVKMVGEVTARIGRFLFSPTAKRILEQKKSTINFNDILNGKILICNLSQGKLGDDTARLLGTTILTKIQQAALRRADIPQSKRRQFHLYVDEFQEFATLSFAKMLSRIRKYGVDVCIAQQSTSQQQDRSIVDIILANITTMICFRTGNPLDEELMLNQFFPHVIKGEIMNLSRYKFYIKVSATESEAPYSGETLKIEVKKDLKKMQRLIEASQKNWAIEYVRVKKNVTEEEVENNKVDDKDVSNDKTNTQNSGGLPQKSKRK